MGATAGEAGSVASRVVVGAAAGLAVAGMVLCSGTGVGVSSRARVGMPVNVGLGVGTVAGATVGVDLVWVQPTTASISTKRKPDRAKHFRYDAVFGAEAR